MASFPPKQSGPPQGQSQQGPPQQQQQGPPQQDPRKQEENPVPDAAQQPEAEQEAESSGNATSILQLLQNGSLQLLQLLAKNPQMFPPAAKEQLMAVSVAVSRIAEQVNSQQQDQAGMMPPPQGPTAQPGGPVPNQPAPGGTVSTVPGR